MERERSESQSVSLYSGSTKQCPCEHASSLQSNSTCPDSRHGKVSGAYCSALLPIYQRIDMGGDLWLAWHHLLLFLVLCLSAWLLNWAGFETLSCWVASLNQLNSTCRSVIIISITYVYFRLLRTCTHFHFEICSAAFALPCH